LRAIEQPISTVVRSTRSPRSTTARVRAALAALLLGVLGLTSITPPTNAAVQGTSGETSSTGSVDIDLILGLHDLSLGTWSGTGSMTGNDNVCIGTIGTGAPYRIRVSGDGAPGNPSAFTLSNGAQTITYNAWFNDVPNNGAGRQALTPGVTLTGQTSPNFVRFFNMFGCIFLNANISIEVPEAELAGGTGSYTGTLTLLLLPE